MQTYFYFSGELRFKEYLKDGKEDGLTTEWYENGQKKQEGLYKDGNLISYKYWNEDGSVKEWLNETHLSQIMN